MLAPLNLGMWTSRLQCVLSSRAESGKGRERPGVCGKWYVEGFPCFPFLAQLMFPTCFLGARRAHTLHPLPAARCHRLPSGLHQWAPAVVRSGSCDNSIDRVAYSINRRHLFLTILKAGSP